MDELGCLGDVVTLTQNRLGNLQELESFEKKDA